MILGHKRARTDQPDTSLDQSALARSSRKNGGVLCMNQTRQVRFTETIFEIPYGQVCLFGIHYFMYLKLSGNKGLTFEPWQTLGQKRARFFAILVIYELYLV
jgi:hypothetical protein